MLSYALARIPHQQKKSLFLTPPKEVICRKCTASIRGKKLGGKNLVCSISKRVAVCSKHKIKKKKVGADAFTKLNRKKSVVACVQHACTAGTKF